MAEDSEEYIKLKGELKGHTDWVTCIATALDDPSMIVTGSRDKTLVVWKLGYVRRGERGTSQLVGKMVKRLTGHSHFVEALDISSDRQYCLSGSWDGTLRLWNLRTGVTTKRFMSHTRDVLSVAFSADNRQIVSGSRDKTIKLWNTIGVCKHTMDDEGGHTDWVTCVQFSPNVEEPVIVSASRDRTVKVWNLHDLRLKYNLTGHENYINAVTVSPDGSLCASGGKDGQTMLWDLNEGKQLSTLDAGGEINALTFSPNRYWLCGAVRGAIKIWDLETKAVVGTLQPRKFEKYARKKKRVPIICTSLAWSVDGQTLFAGYSDNKVRVWQLSRSRSGRRRAAK